MLLNNFDIKIDQKDTSEFTGFLYACETNNLESVDFLV